MKDINLNASYLHRMASDCRRWNYITLAMIPLQDNVSAKMIKSAISDIFKQWFQSSLGVHIIEWLTGFLFINQSDALGLESMFTEEEIF